MTKPRLISIDLKDYSDVFDQCQKSDSWADFKEVLRSERFQQAKQEEGNETATTTDEEFRVPLNAFLEELQKELSPGKVTILNGHEKSDPPFKVFVQRENRYETQGYVGTIAFEGVRINIGSRFDSASNQRFLVNVFARAYGVRQRFFEQMDVVARYEYTWDILLLLLFCHQLTTAMRGGLFRQYKEFDCNDANLKGRIDFPRHIKDNIPPNGRIAYHTREHTVANDINVLILKAYQCLSRKYGQLLQDILNRDEVARKGIHALQGAIPEWTQAPVRAVLTRTSKKIVQCSYIKYEPLRTSAHAILSRLGLNSYVHDKNVVSGVLIYMPKLWEKYLHNVVMKHIGNPPDWKEEYKSPIIDKKRTIKPDFYSQRLEAVVDAKYKGHWGETLAKQKAWGDEVRDDTFQVMAYMLALNCKYGAVVFPVQGQKDSVIADCIPSKDKPTTVGVISELCPGRFFFRVPYIVPEASVSNTDFRNGLRKVEALIQEQLGAVLSPAQQPAKANPSSQGGKDTEVVSSTAS